MAFLRDFLFNLITHIPYRESPMRAPRYAMQELMQYELFYLVGGSKEADISKIKTDLAEIVVSEGGVFKEKQVVEKRKMAYEIKRENRGFYVAQRFNLDEPEKIQSINKKIGLYPNILRALIVRAEELPELTSREEREAKATKEKKAEIKKPVKIEEKTITPKPVAEGQPKETAMVEKTPEKVEKLDEEDINKKLEEILNI